MIPFQFFLLVAIIHGGENHVTLTYPPSRWPPLDFLDNVRSPYPCGVPRPSNRWPVSLLLYNFPLGHKHAFSAKFTTLVAGEPLNVSWSLAYPHKGGYRLSVLDKDGELIRILTPSSSSTSFTGLDEPLTESRNLVLPPDLKCEGCILRLERQGAEWGKTYTFHTCSDINVVDRTDARVANLDSQCMGPSQLQNGNCLCDRGYEGRWCQYKDDCVEDEDCGPGGLCRRVQSSRYPRRVCYCSGGAFGRLCQKDFVSSGEEREKKCFNYAFPEATKANPRFKHGVYDPDCYQSRELGPGHRVHWRLVSNEAEMEFVLDFKTDSWVGLGWRPSSTHADCKRFPLLQGNSRPPQPPPKPGFHSSYAPPGPLHPMDCMDMVIGSALGFHYRVGDYYTRDRSTPLLDEEYGGSDSLTAAFGVQLNASTIIMFRRPVNASERTDHSFMPEETFLVWATGQDKDRPSHSPSAGVSGKEAAGFYGEDELKYHGSRNRGLVGSINLASGQEMPFASTLSLMSFTSLSFIFLR